MKTGFICASGFNLVATATRNNRHLIAVVLGAPSGAARAVKAAEMLESGFGQNPLAWLTPSLGSVDALAPIDAAPPDLHDTMCGKHRKRPAAEDEDVDAEGVAQAAGDSSQQFSFLLSALRAPSPANANLLSDAGPVIPIVVYTGPTRAVPPAVAAAPGGMTTAGLPAAPAAHAASLWSPFSSPALAASPSAELGADSDDDNVPLPRPRPRPKLKPKPAAPTP
jgi:D-alanyl-D-alanine carboxypeptidase